MKHATDKHTLHAPYARDTKISSINLAQMYFFINSVAQESDG